MKRTDILLGTTEVTQNMTAGGASLADVLVQGLTAPVTEAERAAASKPPYPVPAAQGPARDRLVRELVARLPADGDGPLTVTRIQGTPASYRHAVHSLRRPGNFAFGDAACALLAVGALSDTDVDALAPLLPPHCGARRQQVLNRLDAGDLAGACAAADRIADGRSWVGYRDIGAVLADRGDADGFFAHWKRYAATQDRHGMTELKTRLVVGVARGKDWHAALALATDKRLGPAFARYAFDSFGGGVEGLRRLFGGEAAGVLSTMDELDVLAAAVRAATGHNPARNHPLLDEIVDRVIAVDPTTDKAVMRWRDGLLLSLWPAIGEKATLDRVRSAVRTPQYRRQLTTLPRDTRPSTKAP